MNTVAGIGLWLETKQSTSVRSAVFYMHEHVYVAAAVVQERLCHTLSGYGRIC